MRCRKFHQNAVANILGYLFSFTLISMIMLISLMTTTSIVDQKKQEAAGLEAQNVANQISDAMIDTVTVSESLPYAQYYSLLNLPQKFAGLDYNVTLTNEEVTVSTTDGRIQKSTLNYNTENLQVDISGKLTSGEKSVIAKVFATRSSIRQ